MLRRRPVTTLVVVLLAGCTGGGPDESSDDGGPEATLSSPDTVAPGPIEATVPDVTVDDSFVVDVLADAVVSDDELAAAYDGYAGCLADGGGRGRYAYDVALRSGLAVDWDEEATAGVDRDVVAARCSQQFLGDLDRTHRAANPPAPDLAERQRASIVACVEAISPTAAANLPAQITIGTVADGVSVGELQLSPAALDPESLGADPADAQAVADCIASLGVAWRDFG